MSHVVIDLPEDLVLVTEVPSKVPPVTVRQARRALEDGRLVRYRLRNRVYVRASDVAALFTASDARSVQSGRCGEPVANTGLRCQNHGSRADGLCWKHSNVDKAGKAR